MAAAMLGSLATMALPVFLKSDTGKRLMGRMGIDPSSLSHLPGMSGGSMSMGPSSFSSGPSSFSSGGMDSFGPPPSMDTYQRDYVPRAEMDFMGPSSMKHLQQAARNGNTIRIPSLKKLKKLKKKLKGGKKH